MSECDGFVSSIWYIYLFRRSLTVADERPLRGERATRREAYFQQYFSMEGKGMKAGYAMTLGAAGIIFVIALIVILWVIPGVAEDTSPMASPEDAIASCWTIAIANVFFGLAIVGITLLIRSGASPMLLVLVGVSLLLFGLWLLDGAFAFANHGPSMRAVTVVLFACVGGDWLAGMLAFVGTVLLVRFRKREFRAV